MVRYMEIVKQEDSLRKKFVDVCRIPKEVVMGYSLVSILGNTELIIENYRGILEFDSEIIRVLGKIGQIKIYGTQLKIEYYTNEEMKIIGIIEGIEYK